ncbi:MAG TPA: SDR family oxidoreductase [Ktedonobacteraceae bacterium]|nr:SDR family oxidoreductase [Ktedonobacteraceae bacterium]
MIDPGLQGKVVLVTGANHGIGAATAKTFARVGASVFINYLRLPPLGITSQGLAEARETAPGLELYNFRRSLLADSVVEEIRAQGGRVEALEADLSDPATIPRLFDRAEALLGPVDVLVNNADYCVADTFLPPSSQEPVTAPAGYAVASLSAASHDAHFAVNSRAVALMMGEFARRRAERDLRWGRIINVSTDGASGFVHEVSYGASKFAMESYSRAAASELGRYGITVNVVSPGPIQTGYIASELEQRLITAIPLGRVGLPEDVADVIVFLASEQARWLTGQLIFVGGGHRMI